MKYALIYKDDKSNKFWNIEVLGNAYTVTYGKTGTKGTSKTKTHDDAETCIKEADKVTLQKRKKGYVDADVTLSTTPIVVDDKAEAHKEEKTLVENSNTQIEDFENGVKIIEELIERNELMAAMEYSKQLHALNLSDEEVMMANHLSGKIAFKKHDLIAAEQYFLKGGAQSYYVLAKLYTQNREYANAFLYYEKKGTYKALFKAGSIAKVQGLRDAAYKYLKEAITIGEANVKSTLWKAYLKLGALYHTEDIKLAEDFYLKAIAFENSGTKAFNNLGVLYINNNRFEEALKVLNKAIVRFPEHSTAYFNTCCLYALQNQLDEANVWLEKALYYGFDRYKVKVDSDLKELIKTPVYKELMARYSFENRYLHHYKSKILQEHPEVIEDISFYKMPIEKGFEEVLKKAINVTQFSFDGALKTFPTVITKFKKLEKVKLTNNSIQDFPEEFLKMDIDCVSLELKFLKEFPVALGRLKNLEYFQLGSFKFQEIPKDIARFSDLITLTIKHAKVLTSIHREIGSLSNLCVLEIRDTTLTHLPVEIAELKKLSELTLSENPNIKYLPEEIFTMPSLDRIILHKNGFASTEATKLFEEGKQRRMEKRIMGVFLAILQDNDAYVEKNATFKDFLLALNSSVSMLRNKVLLRLNKQDLTVDLDANSEVLVLGKFDKSITAVKNEVKDMGYAVAKKWSAKTTHILIGEKPGDKLIPLLDKTVCWVTEKQIRPEDTKKSTPAVALNEMMTQQIKTLLDSTDDTNLTMAIEMIEATQSANVFAMCLFLNYQYSSDKDNKKNILSLIKGLEDEILVTLFAKKYGFKTASEKKVKEYIQKIPKLAGFNEVEFANTIFVLSGKGVDYLLENGTSEQKSKVLNTLVADGVLDFGYDCDIRTLPEEIGELEALTKLDLSHLKLKEFPVFLTKLVSLENICLVKTRLKTLPKEIANLKNLTKIDLNSCSFKKFPKEVYQLENIEYLSFDKGHSDSSQAISVIPEGISNLKKLRILKFDRNPITLLPNDIGELDALEYLGLMSNDISNLPESFGDLKSLKKLDITCFNEENPYDCSGILAKIKTLEELTISTSQFNVYANLSKMTSLKKLVISGSRDLKAKDWVAEGKKQLPNCEVGTLYNYVY
ncbi:WGR domain-containing protein [Psychroserpens sp. NJDZ02]|uniref:leucine-rich repeat domain-containing protein n=1 Tax=Psychroserpens sp. NJDZ02 TaxID=2570561 RepID=UPI0010A8550A|nr:WGR domain-containing protein [Psychroserpens sp. NJDZ02]QCE40936.1 WGR domain-containing protein [Psychroserpens sp. NJDZ02]